MDKTILAHLMQNPASSKPPSFRATQGGYGEAIHSFIIPTLRRQMITVLSSRSSSRTLHQASRLLSEPRKVDMQNPASSKPPSFRATQGGYGEAIHSFIIPNLRRQIITVLSSRSSSRTLHQASRLLSEPRKVDMAPSALLVGLPSHVAKEGNKTRRKSYMMLGSCQDKKFDKTSTRLDRRQAIQQDRRAPSLVTQVMISTMGERDGAADAQLGRLMHAMRSSSPDGKKHIVVHTIQAGGLTEHRKVAHSTARHKIELRQGNDAVSRTLNRIYHRQAAAAVMSSALFIDCNMIDRVVLRAKSTVYVIGEKIIENF
ncbi:hypothetical protein RRG08_038805 [Elysia crispata]|uniref:Uncharacterized protein n=1 Tax=Elysia crispata TaxID=231223 RepID=A0AAE0YSV3_9GAST|nr:hypothetical protein RRG08_038805 [Elysia crispata]